MKHNIVESEWNVVIDEYAHCLTNGIGLDTNQGNSTAERVSSLFAEILRIFILESKVKDSWSPVKWHATSIGIATFAYSITQKHQYVLGVYNGEIYLNSTILDAKNIKNMPDEFWSVFLGLIEIGSFKFQDNAGLPDNLKSTFDLRGCRSNTYKLIRNFVLLEEHVPSSTVDLGAFEIIWDISDSVVDILAKGTEAMKRIHRLNYLLYRCEYQKRNSKKR
ncbi:hypothetical protein [Methylomonas albis]|uniref:Uncharacterized protein n=1 Tax=Methylomonas albis TaxID=1854563 RepID=A0ABR9D0I6_9GAMM|nr:hypothetical protein [Methylomonas albis]MBD9356321.1 hypothetical protein [Methylomonas albis]CAD6879402.1 hypothetical protein [Methylomonas albis]